MYRTNLLEVGTVSEQALWEDVATVLRNSIASGMYKLGDTLPTELEFTGKYGVSHDTVHRALAS